MLFLLVQNADSTSDSSLDSIYGELPLKFRAPKCDNFAVDVEECLNLKTQPNRQEQGHAKQVRRSAFLKAGVSDPTRYADCGH